MSESQYSMNDGSLLHNNMHLDADMVVPAQRTNASDETHKPFTIATISAGFEKGDFLVREEQGARIYFDFFEEAFNYIANKGYARMMPEEEKDWIELMNVIHDSVKGGMKYNTGTLLMVMSRPVVTSHIASVLAVGPGGAGELKPQHKGKTPSKDLRNP